MLVCEEERQLGRQKGTYQLIPKMHQDKLEDHKLLDQSTKVVEDSKHQKIDDPQRVEAYIGDIIEHLRHKESKEVRPYGYMAIQTEIGVEIREVVIDWLVDVSVKLKLASETLFLAVNYLDRYLAMTSIGRSSVQLLGITCLWIASKYEEIYSPQFDNFVKVCDGIASKADLLALEPYVVAALDFDMSVSSSLRFVQLFAKSMQLTSKGLMMARYICTLTLAKYDTLVYAPSTIAAAAVYLAGKIFNAPTEWPAYAQKITGLSLRDVRAPAKELLLCLLKASRSSICNAVQRKFACEKYARVSLMKLDMYG